MIDFGLARSISLTDIQSELSDRGNQSYRAPEFRGMQRGLHDEYLVPKNTKCDVWSIIQILFDLFNTQL